MPFPFCTRLKEMQREIRARQRKSHRGGLQGCLLNLLHPNQSLNPRRQLQRKAIKGPRVRKVKKLGITLQRMEKLNQTRHRKLRELEIRSENAV
ncbi:non-histone chromosomal protein HMG-17 isoform X1 [Protopterus annectens]|uniref:non-histone chromosomal protein HMG-17 isoform X1 n=1 Tax=Protopterus annectens TaxID=7888 RepID=UPI001CFBF7C5|nr:non-histone chromosomal protein HMG-17 isoform X1 [Protopterus annectens]